MLLVLDVGNTNTMIGVYRDETLIQHWRLETKKERTADELGVFLKELFQFAELSFQMVKGVIISSVVPPLDFSIQKMTSRYLKKEPIWVNSKIKTPIKIKIDQPHEIGADRLVNAVAGFTRYGGPLIVVDFGTATTFDYISERAEYLGGMICPGIAISNEALFERASKLPHVEIKRPKRAIGRNTIESIQAGIYFGYVGMVDEIVRRMMSEMKEREDKKPKVIATGGFSNLIIRDSKMLDTADEFLTLEGLRLIYIQNQKKKR